MSSQFLAANFNHGLHAPHYFNGRLLSAEELQADQQAVLTRQGWSGQASGYGVIDGLAVTQIDARQALVTVGIGMNQQGQIIRVPEDITLQLAPQASTQQPINATGRFTVCTGASTGSIDPATQAGAYLLTALPASHFEGQAAVRPIQGSTNRSNGNGAGCGNQWEVEGVQFKIILLSGFDVHNSGITENNLRNQLAHWCYGSSAMPDLARDPFHFPVHFAGIDLLDPADLTPCDLPLAVFYWTGSAISFIDVWSARRRLTRSDALIENSGLIGDTYVALAQARFLQFQDQIPLIVAEKKANVVVMKDYFRFLPPMGFLPVTLASLLKLIGSLETAATGNADHQAPQATANRFIPELRTLLRARLNAEGAIGNLVNRGEGGFDYGTFFESKQYFWIRSRLDGNNLVMTSKPSDASVTSSTRNDPPTDDQLWYFEDSFIISKLTGYALTGSHNVSLQIPPQYATDTSTPQIVLTTYVKNDAAPPDQQWAMDTDGCLVCKFNNSVADIYYRQLDSGTLVISYEKNKSLIPNQQWYLDPYPSTSSGGPFVINEALIEGTTLASLLQQSWYDDAIDVAPLNKQAQAAFPLLNIYLVRENIASPSSPPYIVFTRARRPFSWALPPQ